MNHRLTTALRVPILLLALVIIGSGLPQAAAVAQTGAGAQANPSEPIIRTETRVVLVDAVVTDKKGEYIHGLTAKDFKVWEDNDEQHITSFSVETGEAGKQQDRYMVLFFDNQAMSLSEQMQARQAAGKFIDSDSGPNRYIAVVNYSGMLQVTQNFTTDTARLKTAVTQMKLPIGGGRSDAGGIDSALSAAESDFTLRNGFDAIRSIARSISALPGRKTFILMSSGYLVAPENMPLVTAVINECNKANVALYPVDVRGLVAALRSPFIYADFRDPAASLIQKVAYTPLQKGGGTGGGRGGGTAPIGGGGGRGGGGGGKSPAPTAPSPGRGGNNTGGYNNAAYRNNMYNQSRLLPPLIPNVSSSQQVLYMLANGTGGFVILNSNDLLGGMQRIARDQNEYYLLGYTPDNSEEGKCHALKVKVDRGGASVRARTGYCDVAPKDLLSGNAIEKDLEKRVAEPVSGPVTGSMQAPYFYTSPNRARVNFAMDIPAAGIKSNKVKGKLHAEVNLLGIAVGSDGKTAARFSDTIKFDFDDKKQFEEFLEHPIHYDNQFSIAPGKYALNLAFESGRAFGKLELPLVVEPWDGKQFSLSGLAFSTDVHRVSDSSSILNAELLGRPHAVDRARRGDQPGRI